MKIRVIFSIALLAGSFIGICSMQAQTLSENKAVVLRSEAELWSKGNLAVADELYAPDFVCHFVNGIEWRGCRASRTPSKAIEPHSPTGMRESMTL